MSTTTHEQLKGEERTIPKTFNDGYKSPYFSKPFLKKPSGKDLRLQKNDQNGNQSESRRNQSESRESQSESRGNQSESRGNQSESRGNQSDSRGNESDTRGSESESRESQNGNQLESRRNQNSDQSEIEFIDKKKSPPLKPPRSRRISNSNSNGCSPSSNGHVLSERTLSYVSKTKPSFSQRHKPNFSKQPSTDEVLPLQDKIVEEENSKEEVPSYMYPWRTTGLGAEPGMGLRTGLGIGLEVGLGLEFELSMEPRNVSRPAIRPAVHFSTSPAVHFSTSPAVHFSTSTIIDRENAVDIGHLQSSWKDCIGQVSSSDQISPERDDVFVDDVLMQQRQGGLLPPANHQTRSSKMSPSFLESGVYDKLEVKQGRINCNPFLISGAFDKLLPFEDPQTISLSTQNNSTFDDERDIGASPSLGSSSSPPDMPTSHSPNPRRRHVRRRSEDLSELSVAKERHMSVSPLQFSPQRALRRQSAYESPQLVKRYLSPGVEESVNWEFLPHGYIGDLQSSTNEDKKKRKWSIFGGGDKVKNTLFNPKKPNRVQRYVSNEEADINATNIQGDTPLHCYIKLNKPEKLDYIIAFLVHCKINKLNIDKGDRLGNTPLHLATQYNDIRAIKILLAFGADMNAQNNRKETPLDLLSSRDSPEEIHELFMMLYALHGGNTLKRKTYLLNESLNSIINERYEIEEAERLGVYLSEDRLTAFVFKLEQLLRKEDLMFSLHNQIDDRNASGDRDNSHTLFDPLIAREKQDLIIQRWKSTLEFKRGIGGRVLFLDGGGIRGLIQIEVLALIKKMTGRAITDLFDWIVGTSTGGLLALCMVYADMNLSELRQMYFQLREEVFSGGIMGAARRTEALEHILKKSFKDKRMSDRLPSSKCPQILISAVSTKTNPPRLHFFNNCFDNQYSQELVWKVARYTTAGPTYFTECDNYVDGGVMANNPCMEAWLEISKYYESKGCKPNFAMAVSIGTGVYPPEKLGEVDFFSKGLLDLRGTLNRAKKLIKMLSTALVESERVAEIFSCTCEAIDTSFYRFSPSLSHSIRPDETDMKILVDMVVQTQAYLHEQSCKAKFDKMIRLFKHITEISRGLNLNSN